jgi:hypothetical protein
MSPTMKLRYVKRLVLNKDNPLYGTEVRTLQQWFVYSDAECHKLLAVGDFACGKWCDVEVVEE